MNGKIVSGIGGMGTGGGAARTKDVRARRRDALTGGFNDRGSLGFGGLRGLSAQENHDGAHANDAEGEGEEVSERGLGGLVLLLHGGFIAEMRRVGEAGKEAGGSGMSTCKGAVVMYFPDSRFPIKGRA